MSLVLFEFIFASGGPAGPFSRGSPAPDRAGMRLGSACAWSGRDRANGPGRIRAAVAAGTFEAPSGPTAETPMRKLGRTALTRG